MRAASGRIASPRNWPQAMKNCWSGVKPSCAGSGGLPLPGDLERAVGDLRAGEVADGLAEHELAVVVEPRLDEVAVELVDDAGALLLELLQVLGGPPVVAGGPARRTARPGRRSRG